MTVSADVAAFLAGRLLKGRPDLDWSETDIVKHGLVDSFGLVRLVADIEETFDIEVSDAEFASPAFRNLAGLAALIAAKRPAAS